MMRYCENCSFIACHIRKTRVTNDATMQKQDLLDCHNRKTRVTFDAIMRKKEFHRMS